MTRAASGAGGEKKNGEEKQKCQKKARVFHKILLGIW